MKYVLYIKTEEGPPETVALMKDERLQCFFFPPLVTFRICYSCNHIKVHCPKKKKKSDVTILKKKHCNVIWTFKTSNTTLGINIADIFPLSKCELNKCRCFKCVLCTTALPVRNYVYKKRKIILKKSLLHANFCLFEPMSTLSASVSASKAPCLRVNQNTLKLLNFAQSAKKIW